MTVVEHLVAEALLELLERLARVNEPHVGDVEDHAEPLQVGMQRLLGQLDHLERLLHALEREVLGLARDERLVGGHERVHREQAERRRAVHQHQVVAALELPQRAPQRQLPAHLAAEDQLRLGQAEVGRKDVLVHRVGGLGLAGQHVGDGGRGVGRHVEVVGEVALGVEVHAQHLEPGAPEHVGQGADGRRLAGAALLGEDRDGGAHERGEDTPRGDGLSGLGRRSGRLRR